MYDLKDFSSLFARILWIESWLRKSIKEFKLAEYDELIMMIMFVDLEDWDFFYGKNDLEVFFYTPLRTKGLKNFGLMKGNFAYCQSDYKDDRAAKPLIQNLSIFSAIPSKISLKSHLKKNDSFFSLVQSTSTKFELTP